MFEVIDAMVLRDIVEDLGDHLEGAAIKEVSTKGVTIWFWLRKKAFFTCFTGDGMSYTHMEGDEREDFFFDNHCNEKFMNAIVKHYFNCN